MKKAFTMIELVFVIIIIGILAAVVAPKLMGTRTDADIAKLKEQVRAINTSIQAYSKQKMIITNNMDEDESYPKELNDKGILFGKVLSGADVSKWKQGKRNNRAESFLYDYTVKGYGTFYCAYMKPGTVAQEHASWEYNRGKAIPNDPMFPVGSFKCFKFENANKKIDNSIIDKFFN